jgi:hypothetical protein
VSTILDALRRLQRDRSRQQPGTELERSLALESLARPERSARFGRWIVLVAIVIAGVGSAAYLFLPRADRTASLAAEVHPSARPEREAAREREPTPAPAREYGTAPARTLPGRPAAPPTPSVPPRSDVVAAARPSPVAPAPVPAPSPTAQPSPAVPRVPPPASIPARARPAAPAQGAPAVSPSTTAPRPARQPSVPAQAPAQQPQEASPAPGAPAATARTERVLRPREREVAAVKDLPTDPVGFPSLTVTTIRWHPDPERREVELLFDQIRPLEAREGDIVSGVAIERIDPDGVELRLGERTKRIALGF